MSISASIPPTIVDIVTPYTLIGPEQLGTLYALSLKVAEEDVPGAIVECGVCNGGSAALIAQPHVYDERRLLFLYDTFNGIPSATPEDGRAAQSLTGAWKGTKSKVSDVLRRVGYPEQRIAWRRGLYADTMVREPLPSQVALLHIDCDFYESVLISLRTFAPRVSVGGYIMLDDYAYWPGCRKAFYQWCHETGQMPVVERTGTYGLWWQQGRVSNVPNRDME